jgi:hypothetical protein
MSNPMSTHTSTAADASAGITTGVTGGGWRATVSPWGAIEPWASGEPVLDWHVAADDRWHSPQQEPAVRQRRLEGTAVVETRVRIPDGDAVQRVYSVPDHAGLTLIEIENASPLPMAVAFTHGRLLSARPPTAPIEGIELPAGSVAFPVGHHATLTVALAHDGSGPGALPTDVPTSAGVVRGWIATVERAGRLLLPDAALAERVMAHRCELALCGPEHPDTDPVGFLLAVGQLVRMGEPAAPWLPDVAYALELAAKREPHDWLLAAATDAADHVLARAGEQRARRDLVGYRSALRCSQVLPDTAPESSAQFLAWVERLLVAPGSAGAALLPGGLPAGWAGNNFEVYGVPTSGAGSVSFAVRWHGARPAVLWEQSGEAVALSAPVMAPEWHTAQVTGEALWPQPEGIDAMIVDAAQQADPPSAEAAPERPFTPPVEGGSFS